MASLQDEDGENNLSEGEQEKEDAKNGFFRLEDLKFIKVIGAGAFGTIDKMVHEPTGTMLAVKRVPHITTNVQMEK